MRHRLLGRALPAFTVNKPANFATNNCAKHANGQLGQAHQYIRQWPDHANRRLGLG